MALKLQILIALCLLVVKTCQYDITDDFTQTQINSMFSETITQFTLTHSDSSTESDSRAKLVRLAFHDCVGHSGTRKGDCNGCVDTSLAANAGLAGIRDKVEDEYDDEDIVDKSDMTLADFMHFVASVAVCVAGDKDTATDCDLFTAGKSDLFQLGRTTGSCSNVQGDFPDAQGDWEHVQGFFKAQFGFSNKSIVYILSGGHSLGRCRLANSGFIGPWRGDEAKLRGDKYADGLLRAADDWKQTNVKTSSDPRWQWNEDGDSGFGEDMNLNADVALVKHIDVNSNGESSCKSDLSKCNDNHATLSHVEDVDDQDMDEFFDDFLPRWNEMINHGI